MPRPPSPYADPVTSYPNMDPAVVPETAVPPFVPDPKAIKAQAEIDRQAKAIFDEMEATGSLAGTPAETGAPWDVDSWRLSETLDHLKARPDGKHRVNRLLHDLGCDGLSTDSPEFVKVLSDRHRVKAQGCAAYCATNTRLKAVVVADSSARRQWQTWVDLHAKAHSNGAFKFNHSNGHAALGLPQPPLAQGRYAGDVAWGATTHHTHQPDGSVVWYGKTAAPTLEESQEAIAELRAQLDLLLKGRKA